MAEHNKYRFYGTREEAIAAGYSPCGICSHEGCIEKFFGDEKPWIKK